MALRLFELLPGLIDAIPHIERFNTLADRLLSASGADASASNLASGQIRKDLLRIDTANVSLSRQMDSLAAQITVVGDAADGARAVTIALGRTIVAIERQIRALRAFLITLIILVVILVLLVGWLVLTAHQPPGIQP